MRIFGCLLVMVVCGASAKTLNVGSFSYQTCASNTVIQITDLSVTPDPIVLPGQVTISLTFTSSIEVEAPTALSVTLEKYVNGSWVNVPCAGQTGSCDFSDICADLDYMYTEEQGCPQAIVDSGLGCNCPFAAGTYTISDLVLPLPADPPAEIADGDYHLRLSDSEEFKEISCTDVYFTIEVAV